MTGENYVVKHNKLIEAKGKMTLMEQKILRVVIAELQPEDKDFAEYSINTADFKGMTGDTGRKDLYNEIKEVSNRLMDRKIEIEDINEQGKKRFFITRYLSSAKYVDGEGFLTVKFDPDLKPYLLELKEQFTQYQLKYVMKMKSTHTLRVYELLKQYEKIGKRKFLIDELKQYLGIENDYDRLFDLEKRVLKPSMEEINEQTDISINYQKIKKGRTVVAFEYTILQKGRDYPKEIIENLYNSGQIEEIKQKSGLIDEGFNQKQIIEFYGIAVKKTESADVDPYEYIRLNYLSMEDKGTARNKFAWLKKALENDYANAVLQIRVGFDLLSNIGKRWE